MIITATKVETKTKKCRWLRCSAYYAQTLWRVFVSPPPHPHTSLWYSCARPPYCRSPPWTPSPGLQFLYLPLQAFAAICGCVIGQGQELATQDAPSWSRWVPPVHNKRFLFSQHLAHLICWKWGIQIFTEIAEISNVLFILLSKKLKTPGRPTADITCVIQPTGHHVCKLFSNVWFSRRHTPSRA